jgi:membrane protein YdbS with pleckstrin-like domain
MEARIAKVKKRVKGDRKFISLVVSLMIIIAAGVAVDIVKYYYKSENYFEVKMVDEGNSKGYYCLFIDGENWDTVDYNEYVTTVDENGNANIKMSFLIQKVGTLVRTIFMAVIFHFAFLILDNIFEPFSKRNIKRLRIIAVLTMLLALIPGAIMEVLKLLFFYKSHITFSQINFFVLMTGILLGVLSEVFKYGHELQEEIEQIA